MWVRAEGTCEAAEGTCEVAEGTCEVAGRDVRRGNVRGRSCGAVTGHMGDARGRAGTRGRDMGT